LKPQTVSEAQERERQFWRTTRDEGPQSNTVDLLAHKLSEARSFLECMRLFRDVFERARDILELGGGEGWAACILKRELPGSRRIVSSDISAEAVAALPRWERIFEVSLDRAFPCLSYEIPLDNETLDLVFTFQAAHHFLAHRRTFAEIWRVLRPGGTCLYLHEPTCRAFFYPLYRARATRVRDSAPEDVLDFPKLIRVARRQGFEATYRFDLSLTNRSPVATLYYMAQRAVPLIRHVLPGTKHLLFRKHASDRSATVAKRWFPAAGGGPPA
jgi:SAM-dependent methyltransferase